MAGQGFRYNASIGTMSSYVAGKPIEEVVREYGLDPEKIIKLASNENPLGMPPSAQRAAAAAAAGIFRYPDGNARIFREAVARFLGIDEDWVIAGNGSDEILGLIARLVLCPGRRCVYSQYSFSVYQLSAQENGADCVEVPAIGFAVDLEGIAREAADPRTALVYVTNPNNPTGLAHGGEEIEKLLESVPGDCVVVLDEAYRDFLPEEIRTDSMELVRRHPNVLVTRTFSKAYGLAGLRAGFGVAQPALIEMMNRIRPPFNMNILAQAAAAACIGDTGFLAKVYAMNRAGVEQLEGFFREEGIEYVPTLANFVLFHAGPKAAEMYEGLLARGIIVRPLKSYGLPEWIRISVGTGEQNARFIEAWRAVSAAV